MNDERRGDWMQTATGRKFWPLDPRPEDVHLEDIAHALSMICRFGGHCRTFYSVAEHSVRVSLVAEASARAVPFCANDIRLIALTGLLHDAAEAYIGDMIRPLKSQPELIGFKVAEVAIEQAIRARFSLPAGKGRHVRDADEVLLATEARDIMGGESAGKWMLCAAPLSEHIVAQGPSRAKAWFLDRFHELTEDIGSRG